MRKRALSLLFPPLLALIVLYVSVKSLPPEREIVRLISWHVSTLELPKVRVIYKALSGTEDIVDIECERVVPVTYTKVVSLEDLPPEERKERFIDLMLPSILVVNYEVRYTRENLLRILKKLRKGLKLSRDEVMYVESLLNRCRADSIEEALVKANPVPPSLVIAQAAIESGWGTSRFFVEGNNPFGIWTFKDKEDSLQAEGSGARLRRFDSILEAVREYVYNVNVGWAYRGFRRHRLRSFDPLELSEFLSFYSIERERYVRKVQRLIEENNLRRLDLCTLDPAYIR